jgi:hypothetical protein
MPTGVQVADFPLRFGDALFGLSQLFRLVGDLSLSLREFATQAIIFSRRSCSCSSASRRRVSQRASHTTPIASSVQDPLN